ncbi:MAG: UPF0104 family protein [Methanobacterium sp.]|uniref:UPF0104 family protein n=1 Tax=Methanobacterium sp. TaxID=2164 RepID=UPI003D6468EF|nr:UPF0104 family protein [Methanobacterium sp.]
MKHKALILLFIGIGILIGMILFIGPGNIENAIKLANPLYLALAVLIQFVIYGLWTERWAITVKSVDISIKKRHLFPMLMVGLAVNNLTPSARGGGEPIRGYILSKYSRTSFEKSFATVIADRGLDTFPFMVLAIITIISAVLYFNLPNLIIYILIFAVIFLLIIFFIAIYMSFNLEFGRKVSLWIVKIIKRFSKKEHASLEKKAIDAIHGFQKSMRTMVNDKKVLMYGLPLSFLIWILEILRVYVVFSAFGVDVSLIVIAEIFIISTMIGMIPLIPGGLGSIDGVMIILFSAAGIPPSISAAATIVERLISFWMTSIIGTALLPYFGTSVMDKITKKM